MKVLVFSVVYLICANAQKARDVKAENARLRTSNKALREALKELRVGMNGLNGEEEVGGYDLEDAYYFQCLKPCYHGGTCEFGKDGEECRCPKDWSGSHCEMKAPYPWQNNYWSESVGWGWCRDYEHVPHGEYRNLNEKVTDVYPIMSIDQCETVCIAASKMPGATIKPYYFYTKRDAATPQIVMCGCSTGQCESRGAAEKVTYNYAGNTHSAPYQYEVFKIYEKNW